MKVLQVNLQKSRAGFDLILKAAEDHDACLILAPEPKIAKASKTKWYTNSRSNCAIKVMKSNPLKTQSFSSGDCFVRLDTEHITFYSVYLSFNDPRDTFERELHQLYNNIDILKSTNTNRDILLGGDFNSKSVMWNSPTEDPRGRTLSEWFASLEMTILNRGNTPTFIRNDSRSFIDITVCTGNLSTNVTNWEVLLEENLSNHNTIVIDINSSTSTNNLPKSTSARTWRLHDDKVEAFQDKISEKLRNADETPEEAIKLIQAICNQVLPRQNPASKRKSVYWWNE